MAARKTTGGKRGAPPPPEMLELPRRLRSAMKQRGIKQKQLEELSGVSQAAISPLTRDPLPESVTAAVVARIAKALDVSLNYLLMGVEDELPTLRSDRLRALPSEPLLLDESTIPALYPSSVPPPPKPDARSKTR